MDYVKPFKIASIATALLLGVSSLAVAQTSGSGDSGTSTGSASGSQMQNTGPSGQGGINEASILAKLNAEGYSDVSDLKLEGDKYEATAMKDGRKVGLSIDSQTGTYVERNL